MLKWLVSQFLENVVKRQPEFDKAPSEYIRSRIDRAHRLTILKNMDKSRAPLYAPSTDHYYKRLEKVQVTQGVTNDSMFQAVLEMLFWNDVEYGIETLDAHRKTIPAPNNLQVTSMFAMCPYLEDAVRCFFDCLLDGTDSCIVYKPFTQLIYGEMDTLKSRLDCIAICYVDDTVVLNLFEFKTGHGEQDRGVVALHEMPRWDTLLGSAFRQLLPAAIRFQADMDCWCPEIEYKIKGNVIITLVDCAPIEMLVYTLDMTKSSLNDSSLSIYK